MQRKSVQKVAHNAGVGLKSAIVQADDQDTVYFQFANARTTMLCPRMLIPEGDTLFDPVEIQVFRGSRRVDQGYFQVSEDRTKIEISGFKLFFAGRCGHKFAGIAAKHFAMGDTVYLRLDDDFYDRVVRIAAEPRVTHILHAEQMSRHRVAHEPHQTLRYA